MLRSTFVCLAKVGDALPSLKVGVVTADAYKPVASTAVGAACNNEGIKQQNIAELFRGYNKAILVGVPGAFTGTCSQKHLPGFVNQHSALKKKGVDFVACISVNDAATMKAWGIDQKVGDKVALLADGNGEVALAMDNVFDLKAHGMGLRNKRFAAVLNKGVITNIAFDDNSMVEAVLKSL
eukprot:c7261_g1_i1.p1 GENE.c7261_g1_i1~~c7261_g1_i1.p1  ORF type:complete len:181 (-),score=10.82 c7261_g1_i1:5-547(-)